MREMKDEHYKDLVCLFYEYRELLPPDIREIVEDEMAKIVLEDLINRLANVIVKENKNDSK